MASTYIENPKNISDCYKNYTTACISYSRVLNGREKLVQKKIEKIVSEATDAKAAEKIELLKKERETLLTAIGILSEEIVNNSAVPQDLASENVPVVSDVKGIELANTKKSEHTFLNCTFTFNNGDHNTSITKGLWVNGAHLKNKKITNPVLFEVHHQALSKFLKKESYFWMHNEKELAELMEA